MGRGQSGTVKSNLLLGDELHEALRPRSEQQLKDDRVRYRESVRSMREFDDIVFKPVVELKDYLAGELLRADVNRWTRRVVGAAPVGADYEGLIDRLAVSRLKEECLPLAHSWPDDLRDQVIAAIHTVIEAIENDGDRDQADEEISRITSAAAMKVTGWEASDADTTAARCAAEAAFYASVEPIYSVLSLDKTLAATEWSSGAVLHQTGAPTAGCTQEARHAAAKREADRFVEELKTLPVV